jgi:hypothetical protein
MSSDRVQQQQVTPKLPYYTASITKSIFNEITLKKLKTFS